MDQEEKEGPRIERCNLCMRPYTRVDKASGLPAISQCLWKALSLSLAAPLFVYKLSQTKVVITDSGYIISQMTDTEFKGLILYGIFKLAVLP